MDKNDILTAFWRYALLIISLGAVLLLTGCGGDFSPIDASSTGIFNEYIVFPFSLLIKWIAGLLNGSYGLSIIAITIALRLVILPFMVKQQRQSKMTQEMMKIMKPEMDIIQDKYKGNSDKDNQYNMQRELGELYQEHNFQPAKMVLGCLPMIIQMPFLIGFYYAIRRTPEISEQSFLWFSLGETNISMALIAIVVYYIQARVSLIGLDQKQQGPMAAFVYISPIMIGIISFVMPAALPLYWAVGGIFMIIQTVIMKKYVLNN